MKSLLASIAVTLLLVGCGRTAEDDTAMSTPDESENPLAAYAGEWALQALPMEGDEALVGFSMVATDTDQGWGIVFDHLPEPVPAQMVMAKGDSVSMVFGPYSSALQDDVMVTTESVFTTDGDQMNGHFTASYETGQVLRGRLAGTRSN